MPPSYRVKELTTSDSARSLRSPDSGSRDWPMKSVRTMSIIAVCGNRLPVYVYGNPPPPHCQAHCATVRCSCQLPGAKHELTKCLDARKVCLWVVYHAKGTIRPWEKPHEESNRSPGPVEPGRRTIGQPPRHRRAGTPRHRYRRLQELQPGHAP